MLARHFPVAGFGAISRCRALTDIFLALPYDSTFWNRSFVELMIKENVRVIKKQIRTYNYFYYKNYHVGRHLKFLNGAQRGSLMNEFKLAL